MVASLASAANTAVTGIEAAQDRIAAAATDIAHSGVPTTAPTVAPPLSGGQIGTAASQVAQALQGTGGDLATDLISVSTAKISYEANAEVLRAVHRLSKDTLDIVT